MIGDAGFTQKFFDEIFHLMTAAIFPTVRVKPDFNTRHVVIQIVDDVILQHIKKPRAPHEVFVLVDTVNFFVETVSKFAVVIVAAKNEDRAETVYEISDLVYHVMVLMIEMGISLEDIRSELAGRHVIDHKVKQEKMTK